MPNTRPFGIQLLSISLQGYNEISQQIVYLTFAYQMEVREQGGRMRLRELILVATGLVLISELGVAQGARVQAFPD